jgi:thioredoxin-like negative regulator of GroEL
MLTERYAEAEPLLRRRLERDPTSVEVRADLAGVLSSLGRDEEARAIYTALLAEGGLAATELFNLGIGLFRANDYGAAAEAFGRLTELQPRSRDAWFNRANALFAQEDWVALLPVSERLLELDPLGENALLIAARVRLETGHREAAIDILERVDETPVHVGGLRLRRVGANTTVEGEIVGNVAPEGSPVDLLFTFFDDRSARLGTATRIVDAPAQGESAAFVVTFSGRALSYHYELVDAVEPIS